MATLVYPCGTPPENGDAKEIAPGVLWIRMPMPFVLNHINLWALSDGNLFNGQTGWTLIDTGLYNPDTKAAWHRLLTGQSPLGGGRISRILVTHMHPDHVGMAGEITRKFECALWMTRLEYLSSHLLTSETDQAAPHEAVRFYRRAGWNESDIQNYRARFGDSGRMISPLPKSYRRIKDGDVLRIGNHAWTVIVANGHSPEHACLYCSDLGLLISGDQILPKISSNISVFPIEPDANPLADWLRSISKIRSLVPDEVLVLPAHNEPFRGLHARLDDLERAVQLSLERLKTCLHSPRRVTDLFEVLFSRPITSESKLLGLATGETIAHLNFLIESGQISTRARSDGVIRYQLLIPER